MKVYLGADHGGYHAKEEIKKALAEWGYAFKDLGAQELTPDDDYPQFAYAVAENVARNPADDRGIVFCRSGIGMDIVANKVRGIRCAQVFNKEMARKSRDDDDANVLSIASDYLGPREIRDIVKIWLETPFSNEKRHVRRLEQIHALEKS